MQAHCTRDNGNGGRVRNESGLTTVEMLVVAFLGALISVAAFSVFTNTIGLEKRSALQSLADTEFAAGAQLAQNPARIAPYMNISGVGNCLTGSSTSGCDAFQVWSEFPVTTGEKEPRFRADVNLMGPCVPNKPCAVMRRMRFRWLCTAAKCSGAEVEVKVTASEESRVRERSTLVSIDRRQFVERGQLQFFCDGAAQPMVGLDFSQLRDRCALKDLSTCSGPHAFFSVGGVALDCRPDYDQSCANGFAKIGLDSTTSVCL